MQKKSSDKHFIKKPTYIGGLKAMRKFLDKEIKYPDSALENKIEGTVYLKYEIDYKGIVVSSRVLVHLGYGCDEEAQRIVSQLTFHVGKNPRKLKIKFTKSIKIYFRLPKKKVAKAPTKPNLIVHNTHKKEEKIVYTVIPTPKKPDNKRDSRGYSYTIKY